MSKEVFTRLEQGLKEAVAVASGEIPAASIFHKGHYYTPAAEIASLRSQLATVTAERDIANNLVELLRADLLKFLGTDPIICEGCGAPLDYDENPATTADVDGCWGYVADIKDMPCYRYRTQKGVDRSWPACAALKGGEDAS